MQKISAILKYHLLFFLLLISTPQLYAQKMRSDKKLQQGLEKILTDFRGDAGVYVYHLKSGKTASINADTIFPTASIVKVPILAGLFDKIDKGELKFHQPILYRDSLSYGGSGIMQYFKDSVKSEVSVTAALMMSYSDNTASLWNQSMAGGGQAINQVMEKYGFKQTRVNSRTPGREAIWKVYGWGQTTPREMATLLVKIRQGEIISQAASEKMYRLMSHPYYDNDAMAQIPPYIHATSKGGAVDASRSELVMVNAPHGDYVFYVGTKNIQDQSWKYNNEAWRLIRNISAFLWNYFEPKSDWKATPERLKYDTDIEE